jgi:CelD/BcsL family acetyltransferase involved in cellulose biosynthesis
VLPIVRRGATVSSPTNWHTPQFGLLAADRPAGDSVVGQLFARRAQQFSLGFLGSREPDLELLMTAAEEARYRFTVRTLERQPLVRVQGPWATYERSLSRNLRRDVGRCRRRLGELGTVSVDVRQDPGALEEAFAVEAAGWKGTAGTAIASRPQTQAFYTDVAEWAAGRGSLRLIFLRVDGRAIAFHLALEEGGTYFPLKGGFDPAFRRHSPGKLIIHATLERAFAVGLQRYEFLGAVDDYKQRWANDVHDRLLFQAFSFTAPGMIRRAAFVYGRPVAKRLIRSATR